jgi:hypothetical protein
VPVLASVPVSSPAPVPVVVVDEVPAELQATVGAIVAKGEEIRVLKTEKVSFFKFTYLIFSVFFYLCLFFNVLFTIA